MGKSARSRSSHLSRSGLWLIGGTLLFSVAVLAWALQGDTSPRSGHAPHRPATARRSTVRITTARPEIAGQEVAARPPAVSDYQALLQENTFQPRVVPHRDNGVRPARKAADSRQQAEKSKNAHPAPAQPENTGDWHGWLYNGIAQINDETYALMDQPNHKQSRFVRVGDRLEDATITQVGEKEVALREREGAVIRVERVDAMAALLRSTRTAGPAVRGAPATATPAVPAFGPPGAAPVATTPPGQTPPQPPPATTAAVDDGTQRGQQGRRGRRFQQDDGFGNAGG